jgi:dolichol-phosphate mannosyltransferase
MSWYASWWKQTWPKNKNKEDMPTTSRPLAVIITPTYNERPNIKKLVPAVDRVIQGIKDWEIKLLVVDDSSPDGTADEVKQLQKQFSFVELLVNPEKSGLGGAYLKGMAKAFGPMKADVVFELDADLSHDPKKIPAFLRELDNGADMVLGSRYLPGGSIPANWGLHRKFLSVVGNWFISFVLASTAVRDWTGGYRAIRKSVYDTVHTEMTSERFSGYTFQIGFLLKALRAGYKVTEVPFHFIDRTEGVSKMGPEYLVNILRYITVARISELLASRIFKFLVVGGIGFIVNIVFYNLFKLLNLWTIIGSAIGVSVGEGLLSNIFSNEGLAVILAAEVAILSNYIWNNVWTFQDRKIAGVTQHVRKFLQFNVGSLGSVIIQYITMQIGVRLLGVFTLLTLAGLSIASDNIYLVVGVLIGMIWNFVIYSKVIWRRK